MVPSPDPMAALDALIAAAGSGDLALSPSGATPSTYAASTSRR